MATLLKELCCAVTVGSLVELYSIWEINYLMVQLGQTRIGSRFKTCIPFHLFLPFSTLASYLTSDKSSSKGEGSIRTLKLCDRGYAVFISAAVPHRYRWRSISQGTHMRHSEQSCACSLGMPLWNDSLLLLPVKIIQLMAILITASRGRSHIRKNYLKYRQDLCFLSTKFTSFWFPGALQSHSSFALTTLTAKSITVNTI